MYNLPSYRFLKKYFCKFVIDLINILSCSLFILSRYVSKEMERYLKNATLLFSKLLTTFARMSLVYHKMPYLPFVNYWNISHLDMVYSLCEVSSAEPGHLLQCIAVPASSNVSLPLYENIRCISTSHYYIHL